MIIKMKFAWLPSRVYTICRIYGQGEHCYSWWKPTRKLIWLVRWPFLIGKESFFIGKAAQKAIEDAKVRMEKYRDTQENW